MEIKDALSTAVLEVLEKDNYVAWSVRVKTYLMAQDLWEIVEATTQPPKQDSSKKRKKKKQEQSKQEDDEAAFKAWRKKNSIALNVLQVSCGPDALSEIRETSSAKSAWNILAEKYNVSKNTNSVVLQVLEKDNYKEWSVGVKTYLMAHDLCEIIEATTEPPKQEDDEAAFKAWSKKNSMALHVIQISCGLDTFSKIIEISSTKIAWDKFAEEYNLPNSGTLSLTRIVHMLEHYSI